MAFSHNPLPGTARVILLGDRKAGKTALIERIVNNSYSEATQLTDNPKTRFYSPIAPEMQGDPSLMLDPGILLKDPKKQGIELTFIDISTQNQTNAQIEKSLREANIFVIVLDATGRKNWDFQLEYWNRIIDQVVSKNAVRMAVFQKSDALSAEEIQSIQQQMKAVSKEQRLEQRRRFISYDFTSAKKVSDNNLFPFSQKLLREAADFINAQYCEPEFLNEAIQPTPMIHVRPLTPIHIEASQAPTAQTAVETTPGFFSRLKAALTHPFIKNLFKWLILPAAVAAALVFSGGLAAVPVAGAFFTSLGTVATFGLTTAAVSLIGNAANEVRKYCLSPNPSPLNRFRAEEVYTPCDSLASPFPAPSPAEIKASPAPQSPAKKPQAAVLPSNRLKELGLIDDDSDANFDFLASGRQSAVTINLFSPTRARTSTTTTHLSSSAKTNKF